MKATIFVSFLFQTIIHADHHSSFHKLTGQLKVKLDHSSTIKVTFLNRLVTWCQETYAMAKEQAFEISHTVWNKGMEEFEKGVNDLIEGPRVGESDAVLNLPYEVAVHKYFDLNVTRITQYFPGVRSDDNQVTVPTSGGRVAVPTSGGDVNNQSLNGDVNNQSLNGDVNNQSSGGEGSDQSSGEESSDQSSGGEEVSKEVTDENFPNNFVSVPDSHPNVGGHQPLAIVEEEEVTNGNFANNLAPEPGSSPNVDDRQQPAVVTNGGKDGGENPETDNNRPKCNSSEGMTTRSCSVSPGHASHSRKSPRMDSCSVSGSPGHAPHGRKSPRIQAKSPKNGGENRKTVNSDKLSDQPPPATVSNGAKETRNAPTKSPRCRGKKRH